MEGQSKALPLLSLIEHLHKYHRWLRTDQQLAVDDKPGAVQPNYFIKMGLHFLAVAAFVHEDRRRSNRVFRRSAGSWRASLGVVCHSSGCAKSLSCMSQYLS
jgi:hypothetical protein